MRFEAFLREELQGSSRSEVERIITVTQQSWVVTYEQMLDGISVTTILHCFSQLWPRKMDDVSAFHGLGGQFPQLVLQWMVGKLAAPTVLCVDAVSQQGKPLPS